MSLIVAGIVPGSPRIAGGKEGFTLTTTRRKAKKARPGPVVAGSGGGAGDAQAAEQQILERQVAMMRCFTRFYTRRVGVLQEALLQSPFSPTEARVLYEIAQADDTTATALGRELGLDPGYLSRILHSFHERQLIERRPSARDARRSLVRLTAKGRRAFVELDRSSSEETTALLGTLEPGTRRRLLDAMTTIEQVLGRGEPDRVPYLLRTHRPGDLGWVVYRHGVLYAQEYGWDERFEALVAQVVARFVDSFDARRECCWIAERNGENVGSVFLVQQSRTVAQLRLLLVEPSARGLGIGRRLIAECTRFARQVRFRRIVLWTNDVLKAARHLYESEGYRLISEERHSKFGPEITGQTWELEL